MNEQKHTIYIADDHEIVIDGLKLLISGEDNLTVAGFATDGRAAFHEIKTKNPDIALVDFRMPGMNGLELISGLRKTVHTKFIILSMHKDRRYVTDAINYGASGYLLKNGGRNELIRCISSVISGGQYFSPDVLYGRPESTSIFTPRELEILKLVIDGATTQQIVAELKLSHFTVDTHRKNICRKAGTKTVIGLLKFIEDNSIEL